MSRAWRAWILFFAIHFLAACAKQDSDSAGKELPRGNYSLLGEKSPVTWASADIEGTGDFTHSSGARPILVLEAGESLSGIHATLRNDGTWPTGDYEISLQAMRMEGEDIFCGLTFPVGDTHASLIVGGWDGSVVGISSLDDLDASENITRTSLDFENGRWYTIRVQLKGTSLRCWIDDSLVVQVDLRGRRVSLKAGPIEKCTPFGLATWQTTARFRRIWFSH